MRKLRRDRRGGIAFATAIAAIPLIGAVALGAEGSSWYITRQHTQNAADTAAYSGALKRACEMTAATNGVPCSDAQSVDFRAKQFATQNKFCDGCSPGANVTQHVTINVGTFNPAANPNWTTDATGSFVRAVVTQQQPYYLAKVLNLLPTTSPKLTNLTIGSTAIAQVRTLPTHPCILALTGSISFQGSPNINAAGCGMASNDTANNAIDFTGGGMTINAQLSAAGGCTGTTAQCGTALTHMPPVTNPFSTLDTATISIPTNCPNGVLTAYTVATHCKNDNLTLNGNTDIALTGGVYFISGQLKLNGNTSISGTATFILLPGATFKMNGTGTINIAANASVSTTQLPTALQPYANLLANMALYDQSNSAVTFGGNSNIDFKGGMYLPNAAVTFQGNPTINGGTCGNQLIAKSLAFNGNPTLNFDFKNAGCPDAITPDSQYVALVQ